MLITADWVVPLSRPPIRDGAVLINGTAIEQIGTAEELGRDYPGRRTDFPGCIITPGLVNAHTHLAMTSLSGVIGPMPFPEWLARIPIAFGALDADDIAASITLGAMKAVASGTTVVGDIAYGPESLAVAADTGLGGTFYWEVLGTTRDELPERLYEADFPTDPGSGCRGRLRCGISPHAPYTSGPDLIRATHTIAVAQSYGFAIHAAESTAETELLRSGTGPLAGLAARLAHGFEPPGTGAVAYLDSLGVLEDATLIHGTHILPTDAPALVRARAAVVLCPRSNAYLHNGAPAAWRLERAGVPLALGTDSLASNTDLDLFEEARALHALEPRFDARRLVEMMTYGGARVLGLDEHVGELAPGKQADVAVFAVEGGERPYDALLADAGRERVRAVLSNGIWRVLDGGSTMSVSVIERAAHLAGQKAALALALNDQM